VSSSGLKRMEETDQGGRGFDMRNAPLRAYDVFR
jgi:hypothetical protein